MANALPLRHPSAKRQVEESTSWSWAYSNGLTNDALVSRHHAYDGSCSYRIGRLGLDALEGQIYAITRVEMLTEILGNEATDAAMKYYGEVFRRLQLGGTFGGILFAHRRSLRAAADADRDDPHLFGFPA